MAAGIIILRALSHWRAHQFLSCKIAERREYNALLVIRSLSLIIGDTSLEINCNKPKLKVPVTIARSETKPQVKTSSSNEIAKFSSSDKKAESSSTDKIAKLSSSDKTAKSLVLNEATMQAKASSSGETDQIASSSDKTAKFSDKITSSSSEKTVKPSSSNKTPMLSFSDETLKPSSSNKTATPSSSDKAAKLSSSETAKSSSLDKTADDVAKPSKSSDETVKPKSSDKVLKSSSLDETAKPSIFHETATKPSPSVKTAKYSFPDKTANHASSDKTRESSSLIKTREPSSLDKIVKLSSSDKVVVNETVKDTEKTAAAKRATNKDYGIILNRNMKETSFGSYDSPSKSVVVQKNKGIDFDIIHPSKERGRSFGLLLFLYFLIFAVTFIPFVSLQFHRSSSTLGSGVSHEHSIEDHGKRRKSILARVLKKRDDASSMADVAPSEPTKERKVGHGLKAALSGWGGVADDILRKPQQ